MKRKLFSKVIGLFLAAAMLLSVNMTAFAVQSSDMGSFTVTGLDATSPKPVTVSAYPIITVNIDDDSRQPKYPMYQWNTAVEGWIEDNHPDYIEKDGSVKDVFEDLNDDTKDSFLQSLTAAIKGGTITLTGNNQVASTESVTFTGMNMGVYLLTASGGVKLYKPTTVALLPVETNGTWTVNANASAVMKSEDPSIVKTVTDLDKTVAIGDPVNYKLTVDVPDYPKDATAVKLTVKDTLSEGLTLDGDSITVYTGEGIVEENKVQDNSSTFEITIDSEDSNKFQIEFAEQFVIAHGGEKLTVTYNAKVNENAFTIDSLGNEAFIGYNNDPYDEASYQEKSDPENVYTYGIGLTKMNADASNTLSGAQFEVQKDGKTFKFTKETDGVYKYDTINGSSTVEVASDGTLLLKGLDTGTYQLKETKAPSGCALPSGEITVTITDVEPDGAIDDVNVSTSGTSEVTNGSVGETDQNVIQFHVLNKDTNFSLPATGGMGTMIFTVLGIALMAGAVTMLVVVLRKKRM